MRVPNVPKDDSVEHAQVHEWAGEIGSVPNVPVFFLEPPAEVLDQT